jgi:6-phosphogluconolactonase
MKANRPHLFDTAQQAAAACSTFILDQLRKAIHDRGEAFIAVSGGSTPKLLFQALSKADFHWEKVGWFFVDERAVPPTDDQSNYKLAYDNFLGPVGFPPENVVRIEGEIAPFEAAEKYALAIRKRFLLGSTEFPKFDVIQLGMGPDAHTASLFPGDPLIEDRIGIAAAVRAPKPPPDRVTLLPGVLLAARSTAFLVAGEDKRAALEAVLSGPADVSRYPSQLLARSGKQIDWFVGAIPGLQWPE